MYRIVSGKDLPLHPCKTFPKELNFGKAKQQNHLKVNDMNMGRTTVATLHHWVGYASVGFK